MTTEETRKRRGRAAQTPSTEAQSSPDAQPVVPDLDAIRAMVTQELQTALDPILDALARLETETRKTRVELGASLHRYALPIVPQLKDERGEEEWLEESQGEDVAANPFPDLHPRGASRLGRTSFRAGLPVKEPEMLEILPRQREQQEEGGQP